MDGQKRSRKRAATFTLGRSLASPPHTSPHHHITTILNAICACHSSTEHRFVLLPSPKIPNSETQRTHSDHSPELLCSPSRHSGIIIGFSSLIYSHRAIHSQTIGTNAAGCSAVNVGGKKKQSSEQRQTIISGDVQHANSPEYLHRYLARLIAILPNEFWYLLDIAVQFHSYYYYVCRMNKILLHVWGIGLLFVASKIATTTRQIDKEKNYFETRHTHP